MRYSAITLLLLSALLASCSDDDDDDDDGPPQATTEVEPNGTSAEALTLSLNRWGRGDVIAAGDVDFWRVELSEGDVVRVKLAAYTFDMAAWEAADNIARLTVYAADGTTKVLEHDFSGNFTVEGWAWQFGDIDIPAFYVPADGDYFIAVTQDDQLVAGGAYALEVESYDSFGSIAFEVENAGAPNTNDTSATAEALSPGSLLGEHTTAESDFYSITIAEPMIVRLETFSYRNGALDGDDYFDPEMELFDTDGVTSLQQVNDVVFYDAGIEYWLDTPGTYTVDVRSDGSPDGSGPYLLDYKSEPVPDMSNEIEPNDTTATATPYAYDEVVRGAVGVGEIDYHSFEGEVGDRVSLRFYDASNSMFASFVNVDLIGPDGITPVSFDFFNNNFPTATVILQESGFYFMEVTDSGVATEYGIQIARILTTDSNEDEPNNDPTTAQSISGGETIEGTIDILGDLDVYSFSASRDVIYEFAIFASDDGTTQPTGDYAGWGSDMNPLLTVRDELGNVLASSSQSLITSHTPENNTNPTAAATLTFITDVSDTYYLVVEDLDGDFGTDVYYIVERL